MTGLGFVKVYFPNMFLEVWWGIAKLVSFPKLMAAHNHKQPKGAGEEFKLWKFRNDTEYTYAWRLLLLEAKKLAMLTPTSYIYHVCVYQFISPPTKAR